MILSEQRPMSGDTWSLRGPAGRCELVRLNDRGVDEAPDFVFIDNEYRMIATNLHVFEHHEMAIVEQAPMAFKACRHDGVIL